MKTNTYPEGWEIESTGGGCEWLRGGKWLAITDGEAGLPKFGEACELITLDKNGDSDDLIDPIKFPSLEAAFAHVEMLRRIYGKA